MAVEKTCLFIKPDGLCKKLVGKIISRLEEEGFKLLALKMIKPSRNEFEKFYEAHRGKDYFEPFLDFVTSTPIIVSVWEKENAVQDLRKIIGATDSRKAEKGTLRQLYGTNERRNLVHASDSIESAKREISFFFQESEIFSYDLDAWKPKDQK
jgi:nucleoside-diphosphate kinase